MIPSNVMVGIIICEIITITCDICTIYVKFFLEEVLYPKKKCGYGRLTLLLISN